MSSWKIHDDTQFYFLTSSIVHWMPIFIEHRLFSLVTENLAYCTENKDLTIHGYVIMPNHIHLLVNSSNLSNIMRDFKSFTSKQITDQLKKENRSFQLKIFRSAAEQDDKSEDYRIWQQGFYPIGIESESFHKQKLNYIHNNPVKKGFVTKPEYWFYSSARNYAGLQNYPLEVEIL